MQENQGKSLKSSHLTFYEWGVETEFGINFHEFGKALNAFNVHTLIDSVYFNLFSTYLASTGNANRFVDLVTCNLFTK